MRVSPVTPLVAELVTGFADLADAVTREIARLETEIDRLQGQLADRDALIVTLLDRVSHQPVAAIAVLPPPVRAFARPRRYGVEQVCKCGATFITAPYLVHVCPACQAARYAMTGQKARAGRRQRALEGAGAA
jgi:hypothetical protein